MANLNERLPQNVPGRYYVDASCVDCGMCPNTAPGIFRRNDDIGMSSVHHQPTTPEQIALGEEAKEDCPTESIGNDGESRPSLSDSASAAPEAARTAEK